MRVYDLKSDLSIETLYSDAIKGMIDVSLGNGYIIFLITDNFLRSEFSQKELEYALTKRMRLAAPITRKKSIEKGFELAEELYNQILSDYPELKDKIE